MRRFILCLAALLTLTALLTGCDSAVISVEDEANAAKVYAYPTDNIIGLRKVAVFENHVIAVFDIDKCDTGHAPLEYAANGRDLKTYLLAKDVSYALPSTSTLKVEGGNYILRVDLDRSDPKTKIPEQPVISGLHYDYADIEFSDECTDIECKIWGGECSQSYYQTYDAKSEKWLKVEDESQTYYFGPEE